MQKLFFPDAAAAMCLSMHSYSSKMCVHLYTYDDLARHPSSSHAMFDRRERDANLPPRNAAAASALQTEGPNPNSNLPTSERDVACERGREGGFTPRRRENWRPKEGPTGVSRKLLYRLLCVYFDPSVEVIDFLGFITRALLRCAFSSGPLFDR